MINTNYAHIILNGKRYGVNLMNPLEAIDFGTRAMINLGPFLGKVTQSLNLGLLGTVDLQTLTPAEVFELIKGPAASAMAALGDLNGPQITALLKEALERCFTPQNESLDDAVTFNRWFRENGGDLYPLAGMALFHLVRNFFPSQLVTGTSVFQARNEPTPDPACKSRTAGEHAPARAV